jgi:uncharacterized protein (DUF342 family)
MDDPNASPHSSLAVPTSTDSISAAPSLTIEVSPDGLDAFLTVTLTEGGQLPDSSSILGALADNGIGHGILPEAVEAALASESYVAPEPEPATDPAANDVSPKVGSVPSPTPSARFLIAHGRPAIHGENGWLESLIPEVRSRVPRVDETGSVDYRDLGDILVVHAGDPLMRRHPPTGGTPGLTLLGETIPATPGQPMMFSGKLPGTEFAADDPDLLQAAINGQPIVVRGGMSVEPVFKVDTVGTASGNIDFDGTVVVVGDVSAGMTVRATGDIQIGGVVELATLDAGGSIAIKGGAIGATGAKGATGAQKKSAEEHRIRCGGNFNAAYAQQTIIEAGDSIFIDDMAMQCELSAINHIRVGNKKRGHIIGGSAQATLSITAKVIGSPNRVRTHLEIGVNPLMHKQLLEMTHDRDGKETQLLEVSKLMAFASKNPGKLPPDMLEKARATAAATSAAIAALREEQDILTAKIALSMQSRVTAEVSLHEGVEVAMGALSYRVASEQEPCAIGLIQGKLGLLSLEDADASDTTKAGP